jgi:hypothetical protein
MSAHIASALLAAAVLSSPPALGGEIAIEADGLRPPVLFVEPERQVDFVNQSGRLVHVEFQHRELDRHQHHLVQVVDRIWAVFHQPGPHRYAVHFQDPQMKNLEGTVVVGENRYGGPDPSECGGVTVMGACLER